MDEDDLTRKVKYVLSQTQSRNHECHWPGCNIQVAPALWGCREHWYRLPHILRTRIWASYRIGQEKDMNPSEAYIEVAKLVQKWIKENYPNDGI
jgi:hypothetical protein